MFLKDLYGFHALDQRCADGKRAYIQLYWHRLSKVRTPNKNTEKCIDNKSQLWMETHPRFGKNIHLDAVMILCHTHNYTTFLG